MIAFNLQCVSLHRFEGWFGSSADFDNQLNNDLISCPYCGDSDISKAPSAPNIAKKGNQASNTRARNPDPAISGDVTSALDETQTANIMSGMLEKLAQAQKQVLQEATWVGRQFANEARAIHYGESDERKIYGETSFNEAKALYEEGVSIVPLPFPHVPPSAKN